MRHMVVGRQKRQFHRKENGKHTSGRPSKKDDNEKSHYKDGGKPIRKSRPVWNDRILKVRDMKGMKGMMATKGTRSQKQSERTDDDRHDKHDNMKAVISM